MQRREAEKKDEFHNKIRVMEIDHNEWMVELQDIFDIKIQIEIDKYMKLKED